MDECRALFSYNSPVKELINGFKHRQRLDIGMCLAKLMALKFDDLQADLLVPVPVSYRRFCGRGFNQSWELTRQLSRELGIRCCNRVLRKSHHTPAQSMQPSVTARRQNLRGAFAIDNRVIMTKVNSVTIVDDVVTTMTTVNSLARLLKRHGIPRVQVLCVARTCS
ncbi:MAG: ComF family protein [Proteobacteria bacterium]|nr:ComF family protein [Pseudomonadota bacterium]